MKWGLGCRQGLGVWVQAAGLERKGRAAWRLAKPWAKPWAKPP